MVDGTKWIADAKARLATGQVRRHRAGSVREKVAALRLEIEAARAAGKNWAQIALDLSDGEALNTDAVRIAFDRCNKVGSAPVPTTPGEAAKPEATRIEEPALSPDEGLIADMFAPMFDARDSRGRGHTQASEQEGGL